MEQKYKEFLTQQKNWVYFLKTYPILIAETTQDYFP